MKHIFKAIFFSFILLIFACKNENKDKNSNTKKEIIDDYSTKLDSLIQTTNPRKFNGVILITKNGKTIYSKVQGYSDFENKTPISLDDNFRIQSNSKQITAVLILKEVEKGTIDLQSPIKKYLPNLTQNWSNIVTVHQLLNMSSGIKSLDEPLLFKPGTGFYYSNPAYGLLGRILTKVTGKEYVEVANKLFKSLGMNNTYCYEMDKKNQKLINGYWITDNETEVVKFDSLNFNKTTWKDFLPTGGIISNPKDLNLWDKQLHNGKILQPKTYTAMISSEVIDEDYTFSDHKSNYGYGIDINNKIIKYIGHSGRGIGFVNLKFYVPEKDLDVIILENIYDRDVSIVYHFEKEIRKIILNSSLVKN